jgi:phage-related protein
MARALAEAFVRVRADTSGVRKDIRDDFGKAGQDGGKSFGDAFTRDAGGRLHDARGRFAKELGAAGGDGGRDAGNRFASAFGDSFRRIGSVLTKALSGGAAGFGKLASGAKVATVALTGLAAAAAAVHTAIAASSAAAPLAGFLALLPGAAVAAAAGVGTLRVAMSGLKDGFKDALKPGTKPKDLAEELKYVSPAARGVALELLKLQPALLGIRNRIQQALFNQLTGQLTAVAKTLAGPVAAGASGVAAQFGAAGKQVAEFVRQSKSIELVRAAFGDTQVSVAILSKAIEPLLAGFRALATEGLSFLPRIATAVSTVATRFGEWLQQIVASGQATQWINNAFATLTQLGGVIKSVGGILSSVFSAASAAGSGFIGVIGTALAQLNAFLKTSAGKSALQSVFQGLASVGQALGPVIAAVVTGLGSLAPPIGRLAQLLGPILTDAVNALAPALVALEPGIRAIFVGLGAAIQVLAPVLPLIGQAFSQIAVALAPVLPLIAQAIAALSPLLPLAAALAGLLAQQLSAALQELTAVLGPVITAVAGALVPIIPQITQAFALWAQALIPVAGLLGQQLGQALARVLPQFAAMIPQLLNGLVPAMIQLLIAITPLLPQIIQLAVVIAENLAQALPQLLPALIQLIDLMVQWTPIMVPILGMILQISTALAGTLGDSVNIALGIISVGLQAIVGVFQWLFDILLGHSIIPDIVNGIARWFGALPGMVIGFFTNMANGAATVAAGLLSYLSQIPGAIGRIFGGAGSLLYNAGRNIVIGLWNGVVSLWNWLVSKFRSLTNLIPHIKGPPAKDRKLLTPAGVAIMQSLGAGITSQIPALKATLGGITADVSRAGDRLAGAATPAARTNSLATAGAPAGAAGVDMGGLADAIVSGIQRAQIAVHMDRQQVGSVVSGVLGQQTAQRRRTG